MFFHSFHLRFMVGQCDRPRPKDRHHLFGIQAEEINTRDAFVLHISPYIQLQEFMEVWESRHISEPQVPDKEREYGNPGFAAVYVEFQLCWNVGSEVGRASCRGGGWMWVVGV